MILNKIDQVLPDDSGNLLVEMEKEIHDINSLASIVRSTRCQVDLSKILNCQAYDATVKFMLFLRTSPVFIISSY